MRSKLFKNRIAIFILYFSIPLTTFLISLFAYWPGLITDDSVYQWEMAKGYDQIDAIHPVVHTLLIKGLLSIWDNPAIISIFGVIFLASGFAFYLTIMDIKGINRTILVAASLFFALSPPNMVLSITMWKDIPYAASIMYATSIIIYATIPRKYGNKNFDKKLTFSCFFLSIFFNLCWIFRYNGALIAATGALILIYLMKKFNSKTKLLLVIFIGLSLSIFSNYLLPHMVNAIPDTYEYTTRFMARQLIGASLENDALSKANNNKLWQIFDKKRVAANFIPEDFSPILWDDSYWDKFDTIKSDRLEIKQMFLQTLIQKPGIMLKNMIQSSNLVWGITKPKQVEQSDFVLSPPDKNSMGIIRRDTKLSDIITSYIETSRSGILFNIFWRNGIWVIIITVLSLLLAIRKRYNAIIALCPVIVSTFSCLITVTAEYRYVWPLFALMPVLLINSVYELSI